MTLMSAYSVAIYSAEKCTFHTPSESVKWLTSYALEDHHLTIDASHLLSIQQALSFDSVPTCSRIVVLIPDDWLSVSQCSLEHSVPSSLLPLAALSHAVETSFLPPETLVFNYQCLEASVGDRQLRVFACAAEWAEQLCLPFQSIAKSCLLMSQSQWLGMSSRDRSWAHCSQHALSPYQPNKVKQQRARRLWVVLGGISVLLHCAAVLYAFYLQGESAQMILARQQTLVSQSAWSSEEEVGGMTESVLSLIQALPDSVRLEGVNSESEGMSFEMTLLEQDLDVLLSRWQQQYPDWRWEIVQQQSDSSLVRAHKDVVDVSISVFEK